MTMAAFDIEMMAEAIRLARRGLYSTSPNPRVGCVLTRDQRVLARGFHRRAGGPHAEIEALQVAGDARGATAYVTLEPCAHQGRTGPCADALIDAGVARVVIGCADPNPLVAGQGVARMRAAGIEVCEGVLAEQAAALNPGFLRRISGGLPWVRLKVAASLDGRTAMASGESKWITGPAARADVQRWRAMSCAIVTGVGTVLADDPRMDVRAEALGGADSRQPLRVILDSTLRTPASARILQAPGQALLVHGDHVGTVPKGVEAVGCAGVQPDPHAVLELLAARQCNEVLIEAGATVAGAFMAAQLVDELVIYQAPTVLGSAGRPMFELPLTQMTQQIRLQITETVRVGPDQRITARPIWPAVDDKE